MSRERDVVRAALAAVGAGRVGVLATVVHVAGSAYRRPGARMFLPAGGDPLGLVSGGCLESDLAERASQVLASGRPETVLYDMRSPDDIVWGLGLGCEGAVRVLLETVGPGDPPTWLVRLESGMRERRPGVLVTVFEASGGASGEASLAPGDRLWLPDDGPAEGGPSPGPLRDRMLDTARAALGEQRSRIARIEAGTSVVDALVEYVAPSIRLLVFGAGLDAAPLTVAAAALGYRVEVYDHRPAFALAERFPAADRVALVDPSALGGIETDERTAAVLMTHHFLHDVAILGRLAGSPIRYAGLLGPRRRHDRIVAELGRRGVVLSPNLLRAIHGPAGLDVGAETPVEIALSVVAEIQAVFTGRLGGPLRERSAPLHDVWETVED